MASNRLNGTWFQAKIVRETLVGRRALVRSPRVDSLSLNRRAQTPQCLPHDLR
jgi:hypothetical protein